VVTLGQPPLPNPPASIFTDGSASTTSASAGWGVHIQPRESGPVDLWGPVIVNSRDSDWIGALRPTNNTAKVSAFFHALQWIILSTSNSALRKNYNILTDSVYCVTRAAVTRLIASSARSNFATTYRSGGPRRTLVFARRKPLGMRQRIA